MAESKQRQGLYARSLRTPVLYVLAVLCALPFVLLAIPVALTVALEQRSLRRVFFLQERVGLRGHPFRLFKFRTMTDQVGNAAHEARIGRFGRILRNTHLDELPQLINVLKGDMCLIGPRPEMLSLDAWAAARIPGFHDRVVIRPGITGQAQIVQGYAEGGDLEAYVTKLELDRDYLERVSFVTDLSILVRTALWMARARGARSYQNAVEGKSPGASGPRS